MAQAKPFDGIQFLEICIFFQIMENIRLLKKVVQATVPVMVSVEAMVL